MPSTCHVREGSFESNVKITPPAFLIKEGYVCLLIVVAVTKEAVWKRLVKGITTGNFASDPGLVTYFAFPCKER